MYLSPSVHMSFQCRQFLFRTALVCDLPTCFLLSLLLWICSLFPKHLLFERPTLHQGNHACGWGGHGIVILVQEVYRHGWPCTPGARDLAERKERRHRPVGDRTTRAKEQMALMMTFIIYHGIFKPVSRSRLPCLIDTLVPSPGLYLRFHRSRIASSRMCYSSSTHGRSC